MDPFTIAITAADIGLKLFDHIANLEGGQLSPEYVERQNQLMNIKADAMAAKAAALAQEGGKPNAR